MKRIMNLILLISVVLSFAACGCSHDYAPATCTAAATCKKCGETEGEALGHEWLDATLTEPETCSVCGETRGEVLSEEEYYLNMLVGSWTNTDVLEDGKLQSGIRSIKINFDENYKGTYNIKEESFSVAAAYITFQDDIAYFWIDFSGDEITGILILDKSNLYYNKLGIRMDDNILFLYEKD